MNIKSTQQRMRRTNPSNCQENFDRQHENECTQKRAAETELREEVSADGGSACGRSLNERENDANRIVGHPH